MEDITDEELDKLIAEKESKQEIHSENLPEIKPSNNFVQAKFENSAFENKMEDVKLNVLKQASTEDNKFVNTIKENLKEAAIKNTEVEQNKADLKNEQVKSEKKKVEKEQKQTEHEIAENKWNNREKWREFVYNGVKPIMKFVGIDDPMSIILTVIYTIILFIPFLVAKLWNGTVGALIHGACDKDRSKTMKGFIWTILGIGLLFGLFCAIYLFLHSQGIDILSWMR